MLSICQVDGTSLGETSARTRAQLSPPSFSLHIPELLGPPAPQKWYLLVCEHILSSLWPELLGQALYNNDDADPVVF